MPSIIVADDHALVRQGIRALLERTGDMQVVAEAEDGQQAVQLTLQLQPDILLIDLSMPRLNGLEALQRLAAGGSKTRVIVVSIHADEAIVLRALRSGAKGYLLKSAFQEELFLAVRAAASGEIYLSPKLASIVLDNVISNSKQPLTTNILERLSTREREVFQLILEGNTNRQIGAKLQISIKTVDKHRTNLMKKLGVHDVSGLMHIAVQQGLLYVR